MAAFLFWCCSGFGLKLDVSLALERSTSPMGLTVGGLVPMFAPTHARANTRVVASFMLRTLSDDAYKLVGMQLCRGACGRKFAEANPPLPS